MIKIEEHIFLAPHTIYKIGGLARFFTQVVNAEELREASVFVMEKSLKYVVLGAGSNVLISDRDFDGMVIRMTGGSIAVKGKRIHADAGVMMARAVIESGRAGLYGFEWGIGVPGTIGGSVRGNAGCFGGEMQDVVESVEVFDFMDAKRFKLNALGCVFGYRDSIFKIHPEWIIMSVTLTLHYGNSQEIQQEIQRITQERVAKQDIGSKCCGCIFKNAPWPHSVGERDAFILKFPELAIFHDRPAIPSAFLIDHAGMKGANVGNICISNKHANFFINRGGGTSSDVLALIALTKRKVKEKFGIELHEEIQMIGF